MWGNKASSIPAIPDISPQHRSGGRIQAVDELPIHANADSYTVDGNGTVTRLPNWQRGTIIFLKFTGAPTFVDSSRLIMQGGVNKTFSSGDAALIFSDGGGIWRCYYLLNSGKAIIGPSTADITDIETQAVGDNSNKIATTAYADYRVTHATTIASATTTNLDAATGGYIDISGTAAITAITLADGQERVVHATGAFTLTNGANLIIPGGTRTVTVGDCMTFRGEASSVVRCTSYLSAPPQWHQKTATFTTDANSTTSTVYHYRAVGGGAGSGGSAASNAATGGGGAGAYEEGTFSGIGPGVVVTITAGGAGTGGNSSGSGGVNGGDTTIAASGLSTITAAHGVGSVGNSSVNSGAAGGAGGTKVGSGASQSGMFGAYGMGNAAGVLVGGLGGSTPLGSAGTGGISGVSGTGVAPSGFGGGAGGVIGNGTAGSTGSPGCAIIDYVL